MSSSSGYGIFILTSLVVFYVYIVIIIYRGFDTLQVEGIKGTYIANIEVEEGSYGATVISYDKGAEWVPLTAPTLDYNGVPLNCFPVSGKYDVLDKKLWT